MKDGIHPIDRIALEANKVVRKIRTPQEILDQTNELARQFAQVKGFVFPEGYNFYTASKNPPRGRGFHWWQMAVIAQEALTDTEMADVLTELEESETESHTTDP